MTVSLCVTQWWRGWRGLQFLCDYRRWVGQQSTKGENIPYQNRGVRGRWQVTGCNGKVRAPAPTPEWGCWTDFVVPIVVLAKSSCECWKGWKGEGKRKRNGEWEEVRIWTQLWSVARDTVTCPKLSCSHIFLQSQLCILTDPITNEIK